MAEPDRSTHRGLVGDVARSVTVPAVSLIMPTYATRPDWLRQAVASALGQRRCSLELIVVDDGSPRPAAEVLDRHHDERMHIVRTEHRGVSGARDAGFAASAGAFIRFVDADDVLPPDSTATLMALTRGSDQVIACGATRWCTETLEPMFDWMVTRRGDPLRACLLLRFTPMIPSMLFPRRVVEAAGSWDPAITVSEDWDFMLRAFEHASVVSTPEVLTWYRQHPTSASRDDDAAWRGTLRALERYFDRHPGERDARLGRQVASMLALFAAERSTQGRPWEDRRFWRALARDPSSVLTFRERTLHTRAQALRMRLRRLG